MDTLIFRALLPVGSINGDAPPARQPAATGRHRPREPGPGANCSAAHLETTANRRGSKANEVKIRQNLGLNHVEPFTTAGGFGKLMEDIYIYIYIFATVVGDQFPPPFGVITME